MLWDSLYHKAAMKILIVSDAWKPQLNGVVRTYEHLCEHLEQQGHSVRVIGPADFPRRTPLPGYREIELVLAPYRRLKRLIEDWQPDSIHIATEGTLGRAALRYCRAAGRPFTTCYHTQFPDYAAKRVARYAPFLADPVRALCLASLRRFHNSANGVLLATQSLEDELRQNGFTVPAHRFTRGVPVDIFRPGAASLFHDLPRPVALYVGRVAVEKNLEDFLAMDWPGGKVVVGDGPDMIALQRRYPHALFAGRQQGPALAAHYQSADLFVFPSRTDTFGIVLIEALACGLPIAGYNVTGPKDIVTADFLGALHDHDLAAAAQAALTLGSPEHRQKRYDHILENYTWEIASRQYIEAIMIAEGRV